MFELTLICPCRNHVNANWPVYRDTPNSWDNCILFIVQACSKLGCPLDSGRHYTNKMEKDEVGFTFSTLHLFRLVFNQTTRQPDKTELDRGLLCPGEPLLHDTCIPFPFSNRTCRRGGVALSPNNDLEGKLSCKLPPHWSPSLFEKIQSKSKQNLNPRQEQEKYRFPFSLGYNKHYISLKS